MPQSTIQQIDDFCVSFLVGGEYYLESVIKSSVDFWQLSEYATGGSHVKAICSSIIDDTLPKDGRCNNGHILVTLGFMRMLYDENKYHDWFNIQTIVEPLVKRLLHHNFDIRSFRVFFLPQSSVYFRFVKNLTYIYEFIREVYCGCIQMSRRN